VKLVLDPNQDFSTEVVKFLPCPVLEWVPNDSGNSSTDWGGVINAGMGIVGGVAEIATGVIGEGISGGLSTALIIDGVYRIGANSARLGAYLGNEKKIGDVIPSNGGAMLGKIIDGMNGSKFGEVGKMQLGLGFANDAAFFYYTGGNASALNNFVTNPNWVNTASMGSNAYTVWSWYNVNN